ncbi:two-component system regulatory protein YycI [uncultured Limosilactobacillus sp.]|uniref:two-component system regulatory protein YycI n=1 Tax=uncultured Limosilactobacillus sp. TaxID=2837629 RepID=UPI0025EF3743|nr:two-component system regulatory protein YycI [uncultured Limosilactobacillus sp.]
MNFKRIQWIFIIAFVLLDIGLCVSLLMGTQFHSSKRSQSQSQVTMKEMRSDMISFGDLSSHRRDGYYMAAQENNQWTSDSQVTSLKNQTSHFNNGTVTSTFQKPVKIRNRVDPQQQLDQLVHSKRIIHGEEYTYSAKLSTGRQIVYAQMIHGQPVLDNAGQLRLRVNSHHEVVGYTQNYLSHLTTLRPRTLTVSQQQAVTWLYRHNQIANNSRIRHVIFGYDKIKKDDDQVVYVPIWKVNVKSKVGDNNQNLRVNAFSGTLFKMNGNN